MTATRNDSPPGGWSSPLDASRVAAGSLRLGEPRMVEGEVAWLETRPREAGRTTLVRRRPGGGPRDIVSAPFSVRARAHEYGGGGYCFGAGAFYFVNDEDQNIHRVVEGEIPAPLTRVEDHYFADLHHDAVHGSLVCVVEDHTTAPPENRLVRVHLRDGRVETLWHGSDFVSSPRVAEDGKRIVWLAWDRPHMPWTRTRLWTGELDGSGALLNVRPVGPEGTSVFQPEWGPDGHLYFVSDADDWWNLYRIAGGGLRQLTALRGELALPQWVFGMRTYGWTGADRIAAAMIRDGLWHCLELDVTTGATHLRETGWTQIESLSADGRRVAMLAGAANRPPTVVLRDEHGAEHVMREASSVSLDPGLVSLPRSVSFPVGDGELAHGLHYRPHGLGAAVPPLLVKCHGGPTAAASSALDLRTQFWTSRGFAVLDVNYRGSTGYGRPYREKLYGRWGLVDVEDAVAGATWLADRGLADRDNLLISGSSAGGFTVLSALTFHDAFAAGASYYGVSEIATLFETTSKFEADYGEWLLGDDIAGASRERSPLRHADRLTRPVIFFQGLRDRVVLPEQAKAMYEALRSRGVPVALLTYPDEGHGFRQEATIRSCLESELAFYRRVLGIPGDEPAPGLTIDNLG